MSMPWLLAADDGSEFAWSLLGHEGLPNAAASEH